MKWWILRTFLLRRLLRSKTATALLLGAVALASSVTVAVLHASEASIASFARSTDRVGGQGAAFIRSRRGLFGQQEVAPLLRRIGETVNAVGILRIQATLISNEGARAPQRGATLTSEQIALIGLDSFPGDTRSELERDRAYVSPSLLRKREGRELLISYQGNVFSLFPTAIPPELEDGSVEGEIYLDLRTLQKRTGHIGALSEIALLPRNAKDSAAPPARLPLLSDFFLESNQQRADRARALLKAFRLNMYILVGLTLFAAAFSIFNAAGLSVLSLQREIALLLTLGLSRFHCFLLLILEALIIGSLGSCIGMALGAPLASLVSSLFLATAERFIGGTASANMGALPLPLFASGIAVGSVVSVLGASYPAWRGSSTALALSVRSAERHAPFPLLPSVLLTVGGGCVTVLIAWYASHSHQVWAAHAASAMIVACVVCSSMPFVALTTTLMRRSAARFRVSGLLALSNVRSGGGSSVISVSASAIAMTLLIGLGVMIGSFQRTLNEWISYTIRADVFVSAAGVRAPGQAAFLPAEQVQMLREATEVVASARFATSELTIELESEDRSVITAAGSDIMTSSDAREFRLIAGVLEPQRLQRGAAVLLSESASLRLRKGVGDTITVEGQQYVVDGIYRDYVSDQGFVLFDFDFFARTFFPSLPTESVVESLSLYMRKDIDPESFIAKHRAPSVRIVANSELRSEIQQIFKRTFAITEAIRAIVVVICGFGSVIALLQLLWERRRELRTLQILGASLHELRLSVLIESILLALPAAALGVLGGMALAATLVYLVNPLSFGWSLTFTIEYSAILVPVAVVVASNVLLALLPFRRIAFITEGATVSDE